MMNKNLRKIDTWLQDHAPKIFELSLNFPVTAKQLKNFEGYLGFNLPQDFKDLYYWHNGMNDEDNMGSLFQGMELLSLENIKIQRSGFEDEKAPLEHTDPQVKKDNAFNNKWIKFSHDGSRTGLYLDLDPTELGTVGQIIFVDFDYDVGFLVAKSITDLVSVFLNDLNNQLYFLSEDALDDDQEFLEADPTIDIINWHDSERWAHPGFE
ncbi:SMI1/KNR4 family protein [Acinetobacter boissieri]|uniref:Cell wall assembly regulator SMI1 n=1 Tax=Acinetobacter boissieri TaxID=1219383 RepID=A0A1G6KEH4_9GAMM|nr:SMI1/KNR4 family protein [Acinetobacter boissieri]SDC29502.1 Cell wall assembly regulator SMI1 [Acinetobacter boissieri]